MSDGESAGVGAPAGEPEAGGGDPRAQGAGRGGEGETTLHWNKKVNLDNQYMDVVQVDELRVRLEEHLASGTCTLLGHTPRT